jgi:uncharacterized membrane protein YqiK
MDNQQSDQIKAIKYTVVIIVGIILLIGALFISFHYSQSRAGNIVIPAGSTYLGPMVK